MNFGQQSSLSILTKESRTNSILLLLFNEFLQKSLCREMCLYTTCIEPGSLALQSFWEPATNNIDTTRSSYSNTVLFKCREPPRKLGGKSTAGPAKEGETFYLFLNSRISKMHDLCPCQMSIKAKYLFAPKKSAKWPTVRSGIQCSVKKSPPKSNQDAGGSERP